MKKRQFDKEFKTIIVNLIANGQTLKSVCREYDLKETTVYPVEKMCKFIKVSTNAYYKWLKNKDIIKPQKTTEFLKQRIQTIFKESNEIYGSIRVQKK